MTVFKFLEVSNDDNFEDINILFTYYNFKTKNISSSNSMRLQVCIGVKIKKKRKK